MRFVSAPRTFVAVALLAAVAAGCGRPPDEAWLRFVGFRAVGGTSGISVVDGQLLDEASDSVDAAFENATVTVGKSEGGTGILVERARVEYRMQGASPPSSEFPVTLYLAAPAKAGEPTSGTISGLPIVPASLKQWIVTSGVARHPEARLTALVTFFALTDDGNRLEVKGSIPIVLANAGGTESKPTVSVIASDAFAQEDPPDSGAFTVSRTGSTAAALAVSYALSGTATNGTDYQTLDGSVVIPAGSATASLIVTPILDAIVEVPAETVIVTLSPSSSYTVGAQDVATVSIKD